MTLYMFQLTFYCEFQKDFQSRFRRFIRKTSSRNPGTKLQALRQFSKIFGKTSNSIIYYFKSKHICSIAGSSKLSRVYGVP